MKPKNIRIVVSALTPHTLKLETDTTILLLVDPETAERLKKEMAVQDIEYTQEATLTLYGSIPFTYL